MSYNSKLKQLILAGALAATVGYTSPSIAEEAPKTQQLETLSKALKTETPSKFQGLNNVNPFPLKFDITSVKADKLVVLSKEDVNKLLSSVDSNFQKPKDLDSKVNSVFTGRIIPQNSDDVMGTFVYNPNTNIGSHKMSGKTFKGKRFAFMDNSTGYNVEGTLKGNEVFYTFEQGYNPLTVSKKRLVEFDIKNGKTHYTSASTLNGISKIRIAKNAAKQLNAVNPTTNYTKSQLLEKDELQKLVEQKEAKKPEVKAPDTTLESKVKKHVEFNKVDPTGKIHHGIREYNINYTTDTISHKVGKELYEFVGPNAGYTLSAPKIGTTSGVYNDSTKVASYTYTDLKGKGFDAKAPGNATIGVFKNKGKDAKGIEEIVYGASVRLADAEKTEVNEPAKAEEQKPTIQPEDKPKADDVNPYIDTCYKNLEKITVNGVTYKAKDVISVGSFDTLSAKLTDAGKENYTINLIRNDDGENQRYHESLFGDWQPESLTNIEGKISDINNKDISGWKINNGYFLIGFTDANTPFKVSLINNSDKTEVYCAEGNAYSSTEAKILNGIVLAVVTYGVGEIISGGEAAASIGGQVGTIIGNPLIPK